MGEKMAEYIMEANRLTKCYRGQHALRQVSLCLARGKIYGLIGQNGAGKTTLMRMAAGLGFPTSGSLTLFGCSAPKELQHARKRMGFMIESPGLQPSMTAQENICLHRRMKGIPNQELESQLLERVGLESAGRKKVRHFSMGMKQRLGIALALVGSPELLLLDEPMNGLDPVGMVEIRDLLQRLCQERDITLLMSSHNLPELYQMATDYIIMDQGNVRKEITQAQLEEQCRQYLLLCTTQVEKLATVLEQQMHTQNYKVMPDQSIRLYDFLEDRERVAQTLLQNNILVTNLSLVGDTLENYYIRLLEEAGNG